MPTTPACTTAALLVGILLGAPALHAQVVSGRVVDSESLTGIPVAAVQLFDEDGQPLDAVLTDAEGRFRIALDRRGGPFRLEADALSHTRASVDSLFVADGEILTLPDLVLAAAPIRLDDIVVEGQRSRITPGREWIRRNQLQGEGTFMAGAVIRAEAPTSLAWYVSEATDVWVRHNEVGEPSFQRPPGNWPRCVEILVNRWPINRDGIDGAPPMGYRSIDDIPLDHIAAIEIYESYRQLPDGYIFIGSNPDCGIVNVWLWNSW